MNHEPETNPADSKIEPPVDKSELDEQALEQTTGGFTGLLLPAVQKVRDPASRLSGDPHVDQITQKGK